MRKNDDYIFRYSRMENLLLFILLLATQNVSRVCSISLGNVVNQTLASFQLCMKALKIAAMPVQKQVNI